MNDKKTILFYSDTPLVGGAENQMYLLAKFIDKSVYRIILAISDFKQLDDWAKKFKREEIEVIRLNVFHKHDPRHYFQLKEYIRQNKIDLMHVHVWNPASCRYAFMASAKYNIPTVITEHDPFEIKGIKNYLKKKYLNKVKKIIAVSGANEMLLKNLFPEISNRIVKIHNGIDVTWFESQNLSFSDDDIKDYREKHFEASSRDKVILTVAELHERKGLNYLVSAMKYVVEKEKNVILCIAGKGFEHKHLEEQVNKEGLINHIKFLGFRKDIPHIMKSSDLFVLPSIKEAFGLVLLEAMAAKLPIIASNVGGIPEIIENNENGFLVPPHNEIKLANKINELLHNPLKRRDFSENGYKKLIRYFDAKMMAKNTEKIYDEILF